MNSIKPTREDIRLALKLRARALEHDIMALKLRNKAKSIEIKELYKKPAVGTGVEP